MQTDVARWSVTQLYRYAQTNLGIGEWQEEEDDYPAYERAQIGILTRQMTKRRLSNADVKACVDYCKTHGWAPTTIFGVINAIEPALKWERERQRALPTVTLLDLQHALEIESALGDDIWMDRLLRATPSTLAEVMAEWASVRKVSL